jgi:hypothetical protein
MPDVTKLKVDSRVLHLPMAFRESKSQEAMAKYKASVRPEAAYLPDNVPFVAENNGLSGPEAVRTIIFEASYMVFGLGDVYLGAPCAVPVNPMHRCDILAALLGANTLIPGTQYTDLGQAEISAPAQTHLLQCCHALSCHAPVACDATLA